MAYPNNVAKQDGFYSIKAVCLLIKYAFAITIEDFQRQKENKYDEPLGDFLHKAKYRLKAKEQNAILIDFLEVVTTHFVL